MVDAAEAADVQVAKANFWFYRSKSEQKNEFFELVTEPISDRNGVLPPRSESAPDPNVADSTSLVIASRETPFVKRA